MAKEIVLYDLAEHVTDEKDPGLGSLPSVENHELEYKGALMGKAPFNFI